MSSDTGNIVTRLWTACYGSVAKVTVCEFHILATLCWVAIVVGAIVVIITIQHGLAWRTTTKTIAPIIQGAHVIVRAFNGGILGNRETSKDRIAFVVRAWCWFGTMQW